ncbi:MAG: YiiX/YebB-like N1pC/P60 family cysteine hydrolase [Opitutaceae bacterium]|jgi:hypothetical protein
MKILPQSKAAKIRFALLAAALLAVVVFCRLDRVVIFFVSDKQEGDIVFQSLPHLDLVDAIEAVTESPWSHCGILVKRDGRWMVAEAIGQVRYTPLYVWMVRGRRSVIESYRVRNLSPASAPRIKVGVDKLIGRSYDFRYAPDDDEIYCSELVYKVYDRELGIKIGEWEKLGDLNWKPMEKFIRSMEGVRLPLSREMITPIGLTRSPVVVRVFTNRD